MTAATANTTRHKLTRSRGRRVVLAVAVAVRGGRRRLVSVRLMRRHRGPRYLVTRSVRSVTMPVGTVTMSMAVPVGRMSVAVSVTSVSCISPDVCSVGQGLHIDGSIAESDSRG